MITIDRIISHNTGVFAIIGNDGEELLTIMSASEVLISAVSAGDIRPRILYRGALTTTKLTLILTKWATYGIAPDTNERKIIDRRVAKAVKQAQKLFWF